MTYVSDRAGANIDSLLDDMEEATIEGVNFWDASITYTVDGIAKGSDGIVYKALISQAGNDPVGDPTNWQQAFYDAGNINEAVIGINNQTGTAYIGILNDAGGLITMDNAAANTFTVPANSSVAYPIGTVLTIRQKGVGQTTIVAGGGVTISVPASKGLLISEQHEWASIVKEGTDAWAIAGGLTS